MQIQLHNWEILTLIWSLSFLPSSGTYLVTAYSITLLACRGVKVAVT